MINPLIKHILQSTDGLGPKGILSQINLAKKEVSGFFTEDKSHEPYMDYGQFKSHHDRNRAIEIFSTSLLQQERVKSFLVMVLMVIQKANSGTT